MFIMLIWFSTNPNEKKKLFKRESNPMTIWALKFTIIIKRMCTWCMNRFHRLAATPLWKGLKGQQNITLCVCATDQCTFESFNRSYQLFIVWFQSIRVHTHVGAVSYNTINLIKFRLKLKRCLCSVYTFWRSKEKTDHGTVISFLLFSWGVPRLNENCNQKSLALNGGAAVAVEANIEEKVESRIMIIELN